MSQRSEKTLASMKQVSDLLVERPVTAREICGLLHCSKPTAYERINSWRKWGRTTGLTLEITLVREGKKGPRSKAYKLVPEVEKKTRRAA